MSNLPVRTIGTKEVDLTIFSEMQRRFDEIRRRAYDLFELRGALLGHEMEDWLQAESEVMGRAFSDLVEKPEAYELKLELPGFEPDEVEVTATESELMVHALAKKNVNDEFDSQEVYRRVKLPVAIDLDQTRAKLEKGILRITAKKVADEESRVEKPAEPAKIKVTKAEHKVSTAA